MYRIKAPDWKNRDFKKIGEGGEAVIYKIRDDAVAKIFHPPDAPEFVTDSTLRDAARAKLAEMQTKLLEFPTDLPKALIAPTGVLIDRRGEVFGYVMPFVEGTSLDQETRTDSKLSLKKRFQVITELHDLITGLHAKDVVVGDLSENNLLLCKKNSELRMIDADSLQFGRYLCKTFVARFVDPKILGIGKMANGMPTKPQKTRKPRATGRKSSTQTTRKRKTKKVEADLIGGMSQSKVAYSLIAPHYKLGDWYSFLVTVMRLLTFTDPYGGVIPGLGLSERLENRATVFDRRVIYPENAKSLKEVPRPILEIFFQVFHRGERFVPDKAVFECLLGKSLVSTEKTENKNQAKP